MKKFIVALLGLLFLVNTSANGMVFFLFHKLRIFATETDATETDATETDATETNELEAQKIDESYSQMPKEEKNEAELVAYHCRLHEKLSKKLKQKKEN